MGNFLGLFSRTPALPRVPAQASAPPSFYRDSASAFEVKRTDRPGHTFKIAGRRGIYLVPCQAIAHYFCHSFFFVPYCTHTHIYIRTPPLLPSTSHSICVWKLPKQSTPVKQHLRTNRFFFLNKRSHPVRSRPVRFGRHIAFSQFHIQCWFYPPQPENNTTHINES